MPGYLRRLATTGSAYTAASILSKLIAVALLPLYTRYLTTADYGAAELLFAAVVAASIVVRLGLIEALLRFYYRHDEDSAEVVAQHLRRALLAGDARRPRPAAAGDADLRTLTPTPAEPGGTSAESDLARTGPDRDRRPLGG